MITGYVAVVREFNIQTFALVVSVTHARIS